jgi:hypothetical protein
MATAPLTTEGVSLVEAAEDPRLFGLSLSDRQRELVVLFALFWLVVVAAGRQSGKSLLAALMLVHNLLLRPDLDKLAGSAPRYGLCIANSQGQAAITLAYARAFIERSPLLRSQLVSASETTLSFRGGRYLHALPCSDRLQRGLSASAVVCDELGHFVSNTLGPRVAERVWTAVRPTTAVYGEQATTLLISTPGDSPLFGELFERAQAGELGEGAVSFQASTREMNPRVSEQFLQAERIVLGADYAREYEAQFTEGAATFLTADDLRQVTGRYRELGPEKVTEAVVALDPSFSGDPAAWVVCGRSVEDRRHLRVCHVGRWAPVRTRQQRRAAKTAEQKAEAEAVVLDQVADLARRYGAGVCTDQHLSAIVTAGLADRGVDRVRVQPWTGKLLARAFSALRAHVVANTIELPAEPVLLEELTRIRSKTRNGASTVEIPRGTGGHQDTALALAAAVLHLEKGARRSPARVLSSFRQQPGRVKQDPKGARVYSALPSEPSERELEAMGELLGLR